MAWISTSSSANLAPKYITIQKYQVTAMVSPSSNPVPYSNQHDRATTDQNEHSHRNCFHLFIFAVRRCKRLDHYVGFYYFPEAPEINLGQRPNPLCPQFVWFTTKTSPSIDLYILLWIFGIRWHKILSPTTCGKQASKQQTDQPTVWSRVLDKPTVHHLGMEFPALHGTRTFITVFTTSCHLFISWAR
jgi:hypothetical protein